MVVAGPHPTGHSSRARGRPRTHHLLAPAKLENGRSSNRHFASVFICSGAAPVAGISIFWKSLARRSHVPGAGGTTELVQALPGISDQRHGNARIHGVLHHSGVEHVHVERLIHDDVVEAAPQARRDRFTERRMCRRLQGCPRQCREPRRACRTRPRPPARSAGSTKTRFRCCPITGCPCDTDETFPVECQHAAPSCSPAFVSRRIIEPSCHRPWPQNTRRPSYEAVYDEEQ